MYMPIITPLVRQLAMLKDVTKHCAVLLLMLQTAGNCSPGCWLVAGGVPCGHA